MTHQPDTAVVFFSRGGNTRLGAEILSERLKAGLVELKERRPGNALQALLRMKSQLEGDPWKDIAGARRVYLMSPIWAGSTAPAMNAFAAGADFTDKDVYVVTFQNAPDPNLSYREQQYLAGIVTRNHGSVRECYALLGAKMGQFAGRESILSEIGKVRLPEDLAANMNEEAPAEEVRVAEETPFVEEVSAVEEVPAVDDALAADAIPAVEQAPAAEEASITEEVSAADAISTVEEAPAAEEVPNAEEAPAEGEVPAAESPTVDTAAEDDPASEEAPEEGFQETA